MAVSRAPARGPNASGAHMPCKHPDQRCLYIHNDSDPLIQKTQIYKGQSPYRKMQNQITFPSTYLRIEAQETFLRPQSSLPQTQESASRSTRGQPRVMTTELCPPSFLDMNTVWVPPVCAAYGSNLCLHHPRAHSHCLQDPPP